MLLRDLPENEGLGLEEEAVDEDVGDVLDRTYNPNKG